MLPLAVVGYLLDAFLQNFFAEGYACAVVVRMHLSVEDTLLGLKQFHA
jgi:hypothetical protein